MWTSENTWKKSFWSGAIENSNTDEIYIRKLKAARYLLIIKIGRKTHLVLGNEKQRVLTVRAQDMVQIIPSPQTLSRSEASEVIRLAKVGIEACSKFKVNALVE